MSERRMCAYCLVLILSDLNGPDGMLAIGPYGRRRITSLEDLNAVIKGGYRDGERFESLSGCRAGIFEATQVQGTSVCSWHVMFAVEKAGLIRG